VSQARSKFTPEQSREYRRWLKHLEAMVALEYQPTGEAKWVVRCPACQTPYRTHHPPIAKYHAADCRWLQAWLTIPRPVREQCQRKWNQLSPSEQRAKRQLP
jgi:hypothetical protein